MIKAPPEKFEHNAFQRILKESPEKISSYLELYNPVDKKGQYHHYNSFRFRVPKGLDTYLAWSVVKLARSRQLTHLFMIGEPLKTCQFMLTPTIQKAISETDRNATSAALEWMSSKIGEEKHIEYLLNGLFDDEAISSSQLEGAATTTKVAKDLLQCRRKSPRTIDEKMIIGNFIMMEYVWENRNKELSLDLISELHQLGTEGIDDDEYQPGIFRNSDDVCVVDGSGDVVHTPPLSKAMKKRLKKLIKWFNTCHHDDDNPKYIHPLIKAICLHFSIGYEHPFRDGNGRVARALFYWYLFKNDYSAFRYIPISVLLKKAPAKYAKSYLYTESDEMDLTYFLDYQCGIILRSISNYKDEYKKISQNIQDFNDWLWNSGLYKKLTEKQKIVFQVARNQEAPYFTINNVKENLECSYNTAASSLNGLVKMGLFKKEKVGREWIYSIRNQDKIMKEWKT